MQQRICQGLVWIATLCLSTNMTAVASDLPRLVAKERDYHLLLNQPGLASAERDSQVPLPDCAGLLQKLERSRQQLEYCSRQGRQPEALCALLAEDLRRAIQDGAQHATSSMSNDVIQHWRLSISNRHTEHSMTAYAQAHGLVVDQLRMLRLEALMHVDASLQPRETSFSARLQQVPKLAWLPQLRVQEFSEDDIVITTNDRLTTCELLGGQVTLNLKSEGSFTYQLPQNWQRAQAHWLVHEKLQRLSRQSPTSPWLLPLMVGFLLGQSPMLQGVAEPNAQELLTLALIHADFAAQAVEPYVYANVWELAARLPQTMRRLTSTWEMQGSFHP